MSKLTINPHIARLSCSMTGDEVDHRNWSSPIGLSPAGFPVTIEYDLDAIAQLKPGPRKGLWRHRNLLPVWGVPDDYAVDVGDTPTFRSEQLSARYNMDVWVKNEGTNPTWSFKDRGLAVARRLLGELRGVCRLRNGSESGRTGDPESLPLSPLRS